MDKYWFIVTLIPCIAYIYYEISKTNIKITTEPGEEYDFIVGKYRIKYLDLNIVSDLHFIIDIYLFICH